MLLPNKPKPLKGADKLLEEINYCCLVFVIRMSNLPCGAARPCLLHAAASACVFRFNKSFAVFAWQHLEIFSVNLVILFSSIATEGIQQFR